MLGSIAGGTGVRKSYRSGVLGSIEGGTGVGASTTSPVLIVN